MLASHTTISSDMAVLTCLFNPTNSQRLKSNYSRFANGMRLQSVPMYTIEAVFGADPFWLPDSPYLLRTRAASLCWQKERLLNHLEQHVPPQYTKLAWIDADILFANSGWAGIASEQLEKSEITQLFQSCIRLDRFGSAELTDVGAVAAQRYGLSGGHTGYAWACRRDLWRECPLFDAAGSMVGDYLMANCLLRRGDPQEVQARHFQSWKNWKRKFCTSVHSAAAFVPGVVSHLWHGSIADRGYGQLGCQLHAAGFDPEVDLALDADSGTWRVLRPELDTIFHDFFIARRSDG